MKMRILLAVLPMMMVGIYGAHADHDGMGMMGMGHHEMMIEHIFGDKNEITKEEFMKHFEKKFDEMDAKHTGKVTKEEAREFFKKKMEEHMKKKFCK